MFKILKRLRSPVYVGASIGLSFFAVLVVALWGLFRITQLQNEHDLDRGQINDVVYRALQTEIELKSQVNAWKNLLIRGSDPEKYSHYYRQFERLENSIQHSLKDLISRGHFLDFPLNDIRELITEHKRMGEKYREGLNRFDRSDPASLVDIDSQLFGVDRQATAKLAIIVDSIKLFGHQLEAANEKEMERVATQATLLSLSSVVAGILFCAFFLTDRAKKEKTLVQAKEAAESANRSKDTFLANISHEIRTPMNAIVGLSEVLSDTELTTDQEEYVTTIRESGTDLLGIINEILDLSKMEAGKIEIKPASFQLRDCVDDAADIIAPRASKKGLEFSVQLDPNLPVFITTDEMRLRQIMINLLGNAVKFTDKGRVDLKLEGHFEESGDYVLSIHISDTGGGIKQADLAKLFEPFKQVGEENAAKAEGTGLGLVISRDLAKLMGGDITVNSLYGEGTTFTVTIRPETVSKEAIKSDKFDLSAIEGKSIAVVDASDFNRNEMIRFLKRWGAEVGSWDKAEGLLEHLERGSLWHLVILGSNIRDIPCDVFAKQLRKACDTQIGAILKWMPYEGGLRMDEVPVGFNGVVHKPVQSKPLIRKVSTILSNHSLEAEAKVTSAEMKSRMGILRPMSIMVVDDNRVNLRVAELILKNHGYEPRMVESGIAALEILEEELPDVIFMDMQMPVMDGLEASRKIRERFGSSNRPWIVALTANAMTDHKKMCMDAGMNDFLPKPVKSESVQKIIQNVPLDISRPPFQVKKRKLSLRS